MAKWSQNPNRIRMPRGVQPTNLVEPAPPIPTTQDAARATADLVEKSQQFVARLFRQSGQARQPEPQNRRRT